MGADVTTYGRDTSVVVQADRGCTDAMADDERTASGGIGACRVEVPQRETHRTPTNITPESSPSQTDSTETEVS